MIQFAFWTGLRTSELIALDWPDIDWIRGVAVISRALTQGMDEPEEGTKTEAGRREVKLLPPALYALDAQKAYTFFKGTTGSGEEIQRRSGRPIVDLDALPYPTHLLHKALRDVLGTSLDGCVYHSMHLLRGAQ